MDKQKLYLRLKGGLGNQLFIYAFGVYCKEILDFDVRFDTFSGYYKDKYGSKPALSEIGLKFNQTSIIENIKLILSIKGLYKSINYINVDRKKTELKFQEFNKDKSLFLEGYFQDMSFLKKINYKVLKEINLDKYNTYLILKNLNFQESICIHHRIEFYNHEIDVKFFKKSFEKIENLINIPNPKYFVFSDSIDLSKEYFGSHFKHKNFHFVEGKTDLEDLKAMSNFKNFILTIGTFGIWASLLSQKKNKIILRPERNVLNDSAYPESYFKIS